MPPSAAGHYWPHLVREYQYWFGLGPGAAVIGAQVHAESTWRPSARNGPALGLAQFMPATAAEMQRRFGQHLTGLCGSKRGCPMNPMWSLRAMVLYDKQLSSEYAEAATPDERWGFTLASYNGGSGWVGLEQRYCDRTGRCDSSRYFGVGNVQWACGRSTPGRSFHACSENRQYAPKVMYHLRPLYVRWFGGQ